MNYVSLINKQWQYAYSLNICYTYSFIPMNYCKLTVNYKSLCLYVVKFHKILQPYVITEGGRELYFRSLKICSNVYMYILDSEDLTSNQ